MNASTLAAPVTSIPVERRFPLELARVIPSIRELYELAKTSRWSPATAVPWASLDAARYTAAQREAACLVWSRRVWVEYTGIAETPALLIRFCVEQGRESDPKYFLTVRSTEEAWHVEAFHRMAETLGGYVAAPADKAWEAVLNRNLYRDALDATASLDAYVAVHCALEDGLELLLYRAYLANAAEPVARALLERVVADKERHAAFGWLYLQERASRIGQDMAAAIGAQAERWVRDVAFSGYTIPSLSTSIDSSAEQQAAATASAAGLGAVTAEAEQEIFRQGLGDARSRFQKLGILLPKIAHPKLGPI